MSFYIAQAKANSKDSSLFCQRDTGDDALESPSYVDSNSKYMTSIFDWSINSRAFSMLNGSWELGYWEKKS